MASEIHKKRTGKSFKITEDIVLKEEMYEEEDDDLPRSYRLLSSQLETSSRNTNDRLEAFLDNKLAMSTLLAKTNEEWRENEINKLFAKSFPHMSSPQQQQQRPVQHGQDMYHPAQHQLKQSIAAMPESTHSPDVDSLRRNSEAAMAPPQSHYPQHIQTTLPPDFEANNSAFTPDFTPDVGMLMAQSNADGTFNPFMEQWMPSGGYAFDNPDSSRSNKFVDEQSWPVQNPDMMDMSKWSNFAQTAPMDDTWQTFINDGAWGPEQEASMK